MKKKIYLILILLIFSLFLIIFNKREDISKEYTPVFLIEDSVVKAERISFSIPNNWKEDRENGRLYIYSPLANREGDEIENLQEGNCIFSFQVGIVEEDNNVAKLINSILGNDESFSREAVFHEVLFIDDVKGLKTTIELEDISYIILEIPFLERIYIFESNFIFTDNCKDEFNNLIRSIRVDGF